MTLDEKTRAFIGHFTKDHASGFALHSAGSDIADVVADFVDKNAETIARAARAAGLDPEADHSDLIIAVLLGSVMGCGPRDTDIPQQIAIAELAAHQAAAVLEHVQGHRSH